MGLDSSPLSISRSVSISPSFSLSHSLCLSLSVSLSLSMSLCLSLSWSPRMPSACRYGWCAGLAGLSKDKHPFVVFVDLVLSLSLLLSSSSASWSGWQELSWGLLEIRSPFLAVPTTRIVLFEVYVVVPLFRETTSCYPTTCSSWHSQSVLAVWSVWSQAVPSTDQRWGP